MARSFFEETGVTLKEEDVENEVEVERSEVEECRYQSPIL